MPENNMKGKIFNAQEVQAILNGSKVMFREVIKPYPILSKDKSYWEFEGVRWAGEKSSYAKNFGDNAKPEMPDLCPYQVGQKIFCKESWQALTGETLCTPLGKMRIHSYPVKEGDIITYKADADLTKDFSTYRSSTTMPQWASRLTLQIKNIGVERLGDISEEDVIAEGITGFCNEDASAGCGEGWQEPHLYKRKWQFKFWWNATHKKPEEKFEANPWVWKITFEVVR